MGEVCFLLAPIFHNPPTLQIARSDSEKAYCSTTTPSDCVDIL